MRWLTALAAKVSRSNWKTALASGTTSRLGRFFQEIGRPVTGDALPQPPSQTDVQRFAEVAGRYHHWLASPEENAAVGINLLA